MTVRQAALKLGKSEQFVRIGLQRGLLPFGAAVKTSTKWSYYISDKRLNDFIGGNDDSTRI
ncbi:MAG: hypothetical protein K0M69_15925 [Youngiibacter sp.]|nr:hypothetical protein [Youngiibacter sp.]